MFILSCSVGAVSDQGQAFWKWSSSGLIVPLGGIDPLNLIFTRFIILELHISIIVWSQFPAFRASTSSDVMSTTRPICPNPLVCIQMPLEAVSLPLFIHIWVFLKECRQFIASHVYDTYSSARPLVVFILLRNNYNLLYIIQLFPLFPVLVLFLHRQSFSCWLT